MVGAEILDQTSFFPSLDEAASRDGPSQADATDQNFIDEEIMRDPPETLAMIMADVTSVPSARSGPGSAGSFDLLVCRLVLSGSCPSTWARPGNLLEETNIG